ncbi:MAG TPA: NAD(P)/FAD-dependent oxidoreductase [Candidatus Paceibacterota bacterium]|nr:NAD(P)/FAD-dependent oxidoreductase [Candidatus Paceibacterota bacterium]
MNEAARETDVLVIGGGPAGMMAAIRAAMRGRSVVLLEKNQRVGAKLDITGGGRCNIANDEPDVRALLSRYGDASEFLFSAFARFGLPEARTFFESRGMPLVTQARQRMFPKSEHAPAVTKLLKKAMQESGVAVETDMRVTELSLSDDGSIATVTCADGTRFAPHSVVLATGGLSHPETGSTGDGFRWLARLGHAVHEPNPSIVPLETDPSDDWIPQLAGTSLSFMKISFYSEGKRAFSKTGKLLFTHFGISGPLILNSAKQVGDLLMNGPVAAAIDLYPDTEFDALERRVRAAFDANKNKEVKNLLPSILPAGMANAIIAQHVIADVKTPVHSVTKEERRALVHVMKALPLTIVGRMGMDRAVVSDGGVDLSEVDTRTFRSKKIPNLFLVGDILHISRPSGGYSLQLCWTSGAVAGDNA